MKAAHSDNLSEKRQRADAKVFTFASKLQLKFDVRRDDIEGTDGVQHRAM